MATQPKQNKDPGPLLRRVVENGYRDAEIELRIPRSTLFGIRVKHGDVYDRLIEQSSEEAVAAKSEALKVLMSKWPSDPKALRGLIPDPVHPAADLFDLWPLNHLCAGALELMETKKLPERIKRLDGKIIDGRNRRLICLIADVAPEFEDIELAAGVTAEEHVVIVNVLRRQMSKDQLCAFAALRYLTLRDTGRRRSSANLRKGSKAKAPDMEKIPSRGSSLSYLACLYNVNARYIADAATIHDNKPEVFQDLLEGKIAIKDARRACGLTQSRQKSLPVNVSLSVSAPNLVNAKPTATTPSTVPLAVCKTADRTCVTTLAQAVVDAYGFLSKSVKSQFEAPLALAREILEESAPTS